MNLRASIKADVNSIFMNEDEFAEPIVYHFRRGGSRAISAVIDRDPPEVYPPGGESTIMPKYTITIAQDCSDGVKASEVDTGGDQVTLQFVTKRVLSFRSFSDTPATGPARRSI